MTVLRAAKIFWGPELIPQFESLVHCAVAEAEVLGGLLRDENNRDARVQRAKQIEHDADEIVHQIARDLNVTYNSPFDREDLHVLASSLDDVIDFSYGAADRVVLYKINQIPKAAIEIAGLILRQSKELSEAVFHLDSRESAFERCIAVKQLEYDADQLKNSAIAELFEAERDAIQLIKVKELYTQLDLATDRAKDAAQVIESMLFKRGPA
jgi:predicted phosphate transport protein (TIGR00153 family)